MTKKHLIFIALTLLVLTLTLALSGCGSGADDLEGKNIAVFELNGGTLEFKTSSVNTKINFAYHPGTYILDPSEIPGYKIYRNDYNFTGWYTSPDCKPEEKWNFANNTFDTETLTLYAGWEKAIVYTYTVYYVDGGEDVELGKYTVSAGERFDDWKKFASGREGHTPIGYFADREFTASWDIATKHPGGESDTDIPVYVNYIEGVWSLVKDLDTLNRAVSSGKNVYLTNNIDCNGEAIDFSDTYTGTFEGNGYTVSNFTVKRSGTRMISCSLFNELGEGSVIRNVSFDNVTYELLDISESVKTVKVSSLAKSANGTTVSNVSISGKLVTNYDSEFPMLQKPFYEEDSTGEVNGFIADIAVEQQAQ